MIITATTMEQQPADVYRRADFKFEPGFRIDVNENGCWYQSRIVSVDWQKQLILVHFDRWSNRYDEWVPMSSPDLRPSQLQSSRKGRVEKYNVGDEVYARWKDNKRYPASVISLVGDDYYEVRYYDGYVRRLRSGQLTRRTPRTDRLYGVQPLPAPVVVLPVPLQPPSLVIDTKRKRKANPIVEQMMQSLKRRRQVQSRVARPGSSASSDSRDGLSRSLSPAFCARRIASPVDALTTAALSPSVVLQRHGLSGPGPSGDGFRGPVVTGSPALLADSELLSAMSPSVVLRRHSGGDAAAAGDSLRHSVSPPPPKRFSFTSAEDLAPPSPASSSTSSMLRRQSWSVGGAPVVDDDDELLSDDSELPNDEENDVLSEDSEDPLLETIRSHTAEQNGVPEPPASPVRTSEPPVGVSEASSAPVSDSPVPCPGLPAGWHRSVRHRLHSGRHRSDVCVQSPDGRKFRSRTQLLQYARAHQLSVDAELVFGLPSMSPALQSKSPALQSKSPALQSKSPALQSKSPALQSKSPLSQSDVNTVGGGSPVVVDSCRPRLKSLPCVHQQNSKSDHHPLQDPSPVLSSAGALSAPITGCRSKFIYTTDEARTAKLPLGWAMEPVVERVSVQEFVCPDQSCAKKFRKQSLLQMHLKHYHPGLASVGEDVRVTGTTERRTNKQEPSRSYSSVQRQSSGSSSVQRRPSGSSSIQRQSSGSNSIQRQSSGSSSIQRRPSGSTSVQRQSSGSNSVQRQSSGSSSIQRRPSGSSSVQRQSSGSNSVQRQSSGSSSIQRRPSGSSSVQRQSSGSNSVQRQSSDSSSARRRPSTESVPDHRSLSPEPDHQSLSSDPDSQPLSPEPDHRSFSPVHDPALTCLMQQVESMEAEDEKIHAALLALHPSPTPADDAQPQLPPVTTPPPSEQPPPPSELATSPVSQQQQQQFRRQYAAASSRHKQRQLSCSETVSKAADQSTLRSLSVDEPRQRRRGARRSSYAAMLGRRRAHTAGHAEPRTVGRRRNSASSADAGRKQRSTASVDPPAVLPDADDDAVGLELDPMPCDATETLDSSDLVHCDCCESEENGLMIQCELCLCWQHCYCIGVADPTQAPAQYVCRFCRRPARERRSRHHAWNRRHLYRDGAALPDLPAPADSAQQRARAAMKASYELTADALDLRRTLYSLRQKLHISSDLHHPKLYMWSPSLVQDTASSSHPADDITDDSSHLRHITDDPSEHLQQNITGDPSILLQQSLADDPSLHLQISDPSSSVNQNINEDSSLRLQIDDPSSSMNEDITDDLSLHLQSDMAEESSFPLHSSLTPSLNLHIDDPSSNPDNPVTASSLPHGQRTIIEDSTPVHAHIDAGSTGTSEPVDVSLQSSVGASESMVVSLQPPVGRPEFFEESMGIDDVVMPQVLLRDVSLQQNCTPTAESIVIESDIGASKRQEQGPKNGSTLPQRIASGAVVQQKPTAKSTKWELGSDSSIQIMNHGTEHAHQELEKSLVNGWWNTGSGHQETKSTVEVREVEHNPEATVWEDEVQDADGGELKVEKDLNESGIDSQETASILRHKTSNVGPEQVGILQPSQRRNTGSVLQDVESVQRDTESVLHEQSEDVQHEQSKDVQQQQSEDLQQYQLGVVKQKQSEEVQQDKSENVQQEQSEEVQQDKSVDIQQEQSDVVKQDEAEELQQEQSADVQQEQSKDVQQEQSEVVQQEPLDVVKQDQTEELQKNQSKDVQHEQSDVAQQEQSEVVQQEQSEVVQQEPLDVVKQELSEDVQRDTVIAEDLLLCGDQCTLDDENQLLQDFASLLPDHSDLDQLIDSTELSRPPSPHQQPPYAVPVVEARIDPVQCQQNLLRHVDQMHDSVGARLNQIESHVTELERMADLDDWDGGAGPPDESAEITIRQLLHQLRLVERVSRPTE